MPSNQVTEFFGLLLAAPESWWPVNAPDKILHRQFPDHRGGEGQWEIFVNGNGEPRTIAPHQWGPMKCPRGTAAVFWNGWLAGLIDPFGGVLAAHPDGANEEHLLRSLEAAIKGETNA